MKPVRKYGCSLNCMPRKLFGQMPRDHTVTKAVSPDYEVTVRGMPWCVDKKVGLALPVGGLA